MKTILLEKVCVYTSNSKRSCLQDVSLQVNAGEFIVLIGRSGCGKTTLTRLLNGLVPHFYPMDVTGKIEVAGREVRQSCLQDMARDVGSVFQDPRTQFFTLHVESELVFSGENLGIPRAVLASRLKKVVSRMKLDSLLSRSIFDLSSGEKQKTAIAAAEVSGPQIYVFDEPSANLDTEGTLQLQLLLQELKQAGQTVVIAEHRLEYLLPLADRVLYLEEGRLVGEFSGREFALLSPSWFLEKGLRLPQAADCFQSPFDGRKVSAKPYLLEVRDISFAYSRRRSVWKGLSFGIREGEVVGVVGANGSGKSTLLKVLVGLAAPDKGELLFQGRRSGTRERRQLSFLALQDVDYQLFAPSVWEEMLLGSGDERRAEELLRFFSLWEYRTMHPTVLSGGQKQRLALALACMKQARILLLDEPTSGMDGAGLLKVSCMLRKLAEEGRGVLVATHDMEFLKNTCSRVLFIEKGQEIKDIRIAAI